MQTLLKSIFDPLSPDRKERIEEKAAEYIAEYKSLQEFRKSLGISQNDIAEIQGIRQVNVSNLEKRSDMKISMLKKYVEAVGCELEIQIKLPGNNKRTHIENLPDHQH